MTQINKHNKHDFIKSLCSLRLPVYIHGPTGCGKTFGFKIIAEELGLPFYKKIVGAMMTESSLLGYANAEGRYVEGIVYKPYTEGGLLVLDEIDNGNPNTNLVVNAICDEEIYFPVQGMKTRHKDFIAVATANTTGNGATLAYVGRNKLDQAMLNRFIPVEMDYDYELEKNLACFYFIETTKKLTNAEPTLKQLEMLDKSIHDFWLIRKTINELEINHILSQRNLIQQSTMLASGKFNGEDLQKSIVFRNLNKETIEKILKKVSSVEIEEFKKSIQNKKPSDILDKSILEAIRKEIEKEKQKMIDNLINSYRNNIRNIELQLSNLEKNSKVVEEKQKAMEAEKKLQEVNKETNKKQIKWYDTQIIPKKSKPSLPNWDETIMGIDPPDDPIKY